MQNEVGLVRARVLTAILGVVAIEAIWILLGWPRGTDNGPAEKTKMRLRSIATALDAYKAKYGRYPTAAEGVTAAAKSTGLSGAAERSLTHDGWGTLFVYREGEPPRVYSVGPNGRDDGGKSDDVLLSDAVGN